VELEQLSRLNEFFKAEQNKAYALVMRSLGDRDDALDVIQDVMCRFVEKYCDKPNKEWAPLFYRMLFNNIKDRQRKESNWRRLMVSKVFLRVNSEAENDGNDIESAVSNTPTMEQRLFDEFVSHQVNTALRSLPDRQRQAFVMRAWLEFDVEQTAMAMQCSKGSVKTHYSRARHALQKQLGNLLDQDTMASSDSSEVNYDKAN
jgi:RNA polymerase sigma-70 factor (ECF subfamily)